MKNVFIISTISVLVFFSILFGCQKTSDEQIDKNQQPQNEVSVEDRSAYSVPTGWTEVANTAKKGCKLFKKGSAFMQVIELDKGARVYPYGYTVTVNSSNQPNGSASWASSGTANSIAANPYMQKQPVSSWWTNASTYGISSTRLYSITNGTFFDRLGYSYTDCSYACRSVYPVKKDNSIIVSGHGGSTEDFPRTKRAFVISVNSSGVHTPSTIGFNDLNANGTPNYSTYSYSNINSYFSPYRFAIVGFKPSSSPSNCILCYTGRTAIGYSGSNIFIYTTSYATVSGTLSAFSEWLVNEPKVVMLDGSDSSQLNVLGTNQVSATRCVGSVLNVYWGL